MHIEKTDSITSKLNLPVSQLDQLEKQYIKVEIKRGQDSVKEVMYKKSLVNLPLYMEVKAKFFKGINSVAYEDVTEVPPSISIKLFYMNNPARHSILLGREFHGSDNSENSKIASFIANSQAYSKSSLRSILEFIEPQLKAELEKARHDKIHIPNLETGLDILENVRFRLKILYPEATDKAD